MRKRNYTAPIIAAGCILLYYIGMLILFLCIPQLPWLLKLLLCVIPLTIGALVIYVLVQRIREIRSGETDDLDQY